MAEDTTTSSVSADATPATDTGAKPTTTSNGATPQKSSSPSLEEALARIAELEHTNKNATEERDRHRKKLSSYEEAERKAQEAALSEVEKANKRATDAEAKIQQYQKQLVSAQVKLAAQAMSIIDPDIAALAINDKLEYGDDGLPTNVDQALKDLIKNKPYLVVAKQEKPAEEPAPESPAQTAQRPAVATPQIPAMNPGRSTIPAPGSLPPGKIPTLSDVYQRR